MKENEHLNVLSADWRVRVVVLVVLVAVVAVVMVVFYSS